MENILFIFVIFSSIFVILVTNPVLSLLWLVFTFMLSSFIFMLIGVEFLSLLIFMVYVGAIAVLFLFVIMMLNIKIIELRSLHLKYFPIGLFIILLFIFLNFLSLFYLKFENSLEYYNYIVFIDLINFKSNIYLIGFIFYEFYSYLLIILALILFVSMIGSIVLIINWNVFIINEKEIYKNVYYFNNKYKVVFLQRFWLKR